MGELSLSATDISLLRRMPIANAGDDPQWDSIFRLFNRDLAVLYWNEETGERGMTISPKGEYALRIQASLPRGASYG